jgi:hypothetical protein
MKEVILMNNQLSFSLSDEVAPYFDNEIISSLCVLIDKKQQKGLKYDDLRMMLLSRIQKVVDLENPDDEYNIYRRAYEFVRYY